MVRRSSISGLAAAWLLLLAEAALLAGCGDESSEAAAAGSSPTTVTTTSVAGAGGAPVGGGSPTGGTAGAAGAGAGGEEPGGEPIVAPAREWTWVDFDDAFCGNGEPTGVGINPGPASELVLVYLMGGGACWDYQSCYVDERAANLTTGFGSDDFAAVGLLLGSGQFDRTDADNPFRDASFVFVPYCTGDVHAGNTVTIHDGVDTHHVGYGNVGAYLRRLVPTFPDATRVVLSGGSAGGYGAAFNWDRTQLAFGSIRVDLIDDSGPWLSNPYLPAPLEQQFRSAWGTDANLPPDCPSCLDEFSALFDFLPAKYPSNRAALLTYSHDPVIADYFGITVDQFFEGLQALGPSFTAQDNLSYFAVSGEDHVMFRVGWRTTQTGGVSLIDWISLMVSDDPAWGDLP